uniref:Paternally expressed 3 n=1 Tax=Mustela putorius furo TaxID=9669 RepID=M3Y501_MUSPF
MLPPKYLSATKPKKSWAPDLYELDSDLTKEPDATVREGATDPEFFHQRFRNFLYVEFVGPRKTLFKLRNLCLDWLQPETRTKEEIIELLVLEQYLTILPEKIKPWVRAKNPENCEKLVTLLENYKGMYEPGDDNSSDLLSEDSISRKGAESPPPRSASSFCRLDWDREREWRGRSRDLESRDRWPYTRNPRSRLPQRDLSLPLMEKTTFAMERERKRRDSVMDYESGSQDAVSYQDVVNLTEDRKPQNPIQDNMENYRKLLSLGVQLAEDDGHSHMTQGHSSRSKRSAYPSTSRGLKTMPETKKSTHRRGICEDESSHGVIMEKFIKDVSRNSKSGRARDSNDRSQRFPRRPDNDWKEASFNKRESVIQERGYEGNAFGGSYNCNSSLVSKKRVLERKRRYHFDTDGKGSIHEQKGCARKRPFECSEMRKAMSMSSLSAPSFTESHPLDCESFIHSVAVSEVQKSQEYEEPFMPSPTFSELQKIYGKDKFYECKVCKETFLHSSALIEHQKTHGKDDKDNERGEAFKPSPPLNEVPKMYGKEKMYECKVCGETFHHSSGRGYEKSVIHSVPFTESQKSHTITRPPESEEDEKAFTISSNPDDGQKIPAKENACERKPYERSVIHSVAFAKAQKSNSAVGPSKPQVIAESTQSSGVTEHQKVHAGENSEGKKYERSVIHSLASFRPPKNCNGNEVVECDEKGESSTHISDPRDKQQKTPARENPYEGAKSNNYKDSVIQSVSRIEPPRSLTSQGSSESSVPSSSVREHQKARAKKKNIERRNHETSVIHSLRFGQPHTFRNYERSVIRSLASTDPQTKQAQTSYAEQQVRNKCKECGDCFATIEELGAHQKIYAREEFHGRKLFGNSVIQGIGLDGPRQVESQPDDPRQDDPDEQDEQDETEDSIYGCKDCGLGFADRADLKDHQKVHGREYLIDSREYTHSVIHTHSVSEYQKDYIGEQLYECPACGESFVHSSFLFEHQKIHEQDQFFGHRRYEEPFMQPLVINPRRPRAPQKNPPAGTSLQCHVCGQDFIHGSVLSEHMRIHTGEDLPEQDQRSEDAVSPGLALTEFQRSQTEEKHYECKTCGESFLNQSDLTEHMRVHEKDEPYDYGTSFVHTSFLTEPPKRDSPFYECKDCGKSFIHNTVLTKHQKLHLEEEEEEGAQEVEANVLVPQEVLRIQGSNVEAAEPEVEAVEPEVEAAEPNVEAAEPNGEAEGPDGEAAEPNGEAEQPSGEAEQPNGDADEPDGAGIEDPEERAEEPEGKAEEPEGDADEPDGAGIEDPEEEGDDQEIQVEEPYYDCRECGETFTSNSAYGEHLKTHARVIIFEPGSVYGESSRYTEHASTSTSDNDRADDKYFKCDVCGQLFSDRLSLARHQNTHTG